MTKLEVKFYDPYKNDFLSDLKKSFDTATEVWIATAFFDKGGYDRIGYKIKELLKKGGKLQFLVDKAGCNTLALSSLFSLKKEFKNKNSPLEIKYYNRRYMMHSKFYFFDSKPPVVFIGSSNLTDNGFEKNIETNVSLKGNLMDFKEFYAKLWKTCRELGDEELKEIEKCEKKKRNLNKKIRKITPNLPPSGKQKGTQRKHKKTKRVKRIINKPKTRIQLTKKVFEAKVKKIAEEIKRERKKDSWRENTYDQIKKAAKKLLRNPTDKNLHEFINTKYEDEKSNRPLIQERFGQAYSNVKQFLKLNSKERRMHFVRRLLREGIKVLKLTDTSEKGHLSRAGWAFPTLLLHLQDSRRNILSNANKILSGLRKDGKIERGANRVEQYKMFNKWANQVKKAKGLRTCEMDIFLARLGGEI